MAWCSVNKKAQGTILPLPLYNFTFQSKQLHHNFKEAIIIILSFISSLYAMGQCNGTFLYNA